ncbi:MAG TPA: aminoglycoside 3'-phosphotransferase/choline kinase family protein [Longimicrobiaceae bacterium]|nr:aminoglycoside 3'-phosphotransferase/choline kinase family protein [Longimicrobiaceae bacterium]
MPLLPPINSIEDYRASSRDEATYAPAVAEICRMHGIADQPRRKFAGGSTIVFAVGDAYVVKLFEPFVAANALTEAAVLRHVDGRLGVPAPHVFHMGSLDGWRYVVMSRLHGEVAYDAWDGLDADARRSICAQVGAAIGKLHALDVAGLHIAGPAWAEFIAHKRADCMTRQRGKALDPHWLDQIPAFLDSVPLRDDGQVLLHTEMMREHVLITLRDDGVAVSGIFDFEPAMTGAREYDFASIGVFLTGGDATLFDAFLDGYGLPRTARDPAMPRRVMAYALLHRYSNMTWYLERVPPRAARTLDELAEEWFGWG